MESYQKSRAYRHFIRHTPRTPRASDGFPSASPYLPKREALECANIQLQPPDMRASIAADLDHRDTFTLVREMDFPPPQLLMLNTGNGHGHAVWQIADAVPFGDNARRAPQSAFMDLQRQITLMYGGDAGYGHYMVKTPGHGRWQTIVNDVPPYALSELLEAIPAGIAKQARQRKERAAHGEGRHSTLWEIGRRWAYGEVKRFKRRGGGPEQWQAHVYAEFMRLNSFAQPLTPSHVRSLARNVANYCWQNAERLNGSVLDGEKRSLLKSWQREEITPEAAKERMVQGARYTHAVRRNATDDAVIQAIASCAARGIHNPSVSHLSAVSGVARSTVRAVMVRIQGEAGTGN